MAKIRKILDESEVLVTRMYMTTALKKVEELSKELVKKDPDTSLELAQVAVNLHIVENFLEEKCTINERNQQVL